jgi:hypothetical protein
MTLQEMLRKWEFTLHGEDQIKLFGPKPTAKQMEAIRAAKPEIIAELKRRAAAKAEAEAARTAAEAEELRALRTGEKPLEISYHDGEILSGWGAYGKSADLLVELGLAQYVSGWGYHVKDEVVRALGEEFTYPEAAEYARPIQEAKAAKKAAEEAARAEKFSQAAETGKAVLLEQYSTDCNDPNESCNVDIVTVWAMPDGTTQRRRQHTW